MELVIVIGIALFVVLWIFEYVLRHSETVQRPSHDDTTQRSTVTFRVYDPDNYKAQDEGREEWLKQHYPDSDKCIFTKVVGVSYKNHDGSLRKKIIRKCRVYEELELVAEPNNPFDSNAIGVRRANGEQLGYLNQRLAEDMHRWMANGQHWVAVLTQIIGNDPTRVGAVLALVRRQAVPDKHS